MMSIEYKLRTSWLLIGRPAQDILNALEAGEHVEVEAEDWQILH